MADVSKYILDVEKTNEGFVKLLKYILNNNGGFLWPLLSFFLFAYAWSSLGLFLKIFISIFWVILFIVSILTPLAQKKEDQYRENILKSKEIEIKRAYLKELSRLANSQWKFKMLYDHYITKIRIQNPWPDPLNNYWIELYDDFIKNKLL